MEKNHIPSPTQILNNQEPTDFAAKVLAHIKQKLADPKWVKDWQYGSDKSACWKFTVAGSASPGDKHVIEQALTEAGWHQIQLVNSSENGERPGMFGVTICAHPAQ